METSAPEADAPPAPEDQPQPDPTPLLSESPEVVAPVEAPASQSVVLGLEAEQSEAQVSSAAVPSNAVALGELPALERFGAPFQPAGDKPVMSVILIDDGSGPLGPGAIGAFPVPLTFALDAAAPDALQRMMQYRDRGYEVMALADLPQNATPPQAKDTLDALLHGLPEVVGVLEGGGSGLQATPAVTDQVTQAVKQGGHGLVLLSNGQNIARLAVNEGVPSATVFRDLDGQGQDAAQIRGFLEQALAEAGPDVSMILVGRLRADTISALLLWGLEESTQEAIDIVPVSSILLQDAE
jgi:polysaccharide deacetylase 2 family uncharacterized protein YibQ